MSSYQWAMMIVILAGIIFNAGLLIGLVKNHIKHVNDRLAKVETKVDTIWRAVARIEGRLYGST